jgi:hypothetical protein
MQNQCYSGDEEFDSAYARSEKHVPQHSSDGSTIQKVKDVCHGSHGLVRQRLGLSRTHICRDYNKKLGSAMPFIYQCQVTNLTYCPHSLTPSYLSFAP